MKILNVNKYYQLTGGGDRFFFDLAMILTMRGHEVIPFCMGYLKNRTTPYSRYFPAAVTGEEVDSLGIKDRMKFFLNGIYSFKSKAALQRLLKEEKPDIAHLHVLHYSMSPSIIDTLRDAHVPIVFSLHDYRAVCTGGYLYTKNAVCERCRSHRYFNAVIHKCYRESYLSSFMGMLGNYLYAFLKTYQKVDIFTVPHQDMIETMVRFGFPRSKFRILRNPFFVEATRVVSTTGNRVIYFGQITSQKGVFTLVEAASRLPEIPFGIFGKGRDLKALRETVQKRGMKNVEIDDVTRWDSGLQPVIASSRIVVSPSEWPVPLDYAMLEAMSFGKAVVASRIGGGKFIIEDGQNGVFFEPADPESLTVAIKRLYGNIEDCERMGKAAFQTIEKQFSPDVFYSSAMSIYEDAMGKA